MKKLRFILPLALSFLAGCAPHEAALQSGVPAPAYRASGYSAVSLQPGRNASQRQLLAIRAAKVAAMRDLAEKIYGAEIGGQTSVGEGRVHNDSVRASVEGLVRSARMVSLQPIRRDIYEAVLEVDAGEVALMRSRPGYR